MSRIKTIKTVAATLTVALALGFVVQYGESDTQPQASVVSAVAGNAPRTLMMATNAQGQAVFGVPNVVTTPLDHAANVQDVMDVDLVYTELNVPHLGTVFATPVEGCATNLTAKRQPAALVELTISAPCFKNADFVLLHEDMRFAGVTDRDGAASVTVPVLKTSAHFAVAFDNVVQATVYKFVPELRQYDRAVLQWRSLENLRLHALEGDAQIGDQGHVWSASIHTAQDARAGTNGFVVYLGSTDADIPYQAEVYTFPAGALNRNGVVDLRIGASVTAANCGREIDAETIQTIGGETLIKTAVAAQMPACDSIGDVVLFPDKFTSLTFASR